VQREVIWRPNPGPQTRFLASRANEVLYGGAAGGGKTAGAIALPLRWIGNGGFRCLYLRREDKYLGDAIDKSQSLYPKLGARFVQSPKKIWTFPSGAQVWMSHCELEKHVKNYDGFEFHLVIFDELTHFTEKQYRGIRARIRGTDPTLPRASRATTNPGGEGHDWVFARFGPWLNPNHATHAAPGEVLWFRADEQVPEGTPHALSRVFIPASLDDNPHVTKEYEAQLMDLDPVRRAQLRKGDWLVKPGAGLYFKREWFRILGASPRNVRFRCRYWDRAATEGGGDWTVGLLVLRLDDGTFVIEHMIRLQGRPEAVQAAIKGACVSDGPEVVQVLEQDPAQAGKVEAAMYARELAGHNFRILPKRVNKLVAAGPASAQVEAGNVAIVVGPWEHEVLIQECEGFPDADHDDIVDTISGAIAYLTLSDRGEVVPPPVVDYEGGRFEDFEGRGF
jgi:predicted phage terminase large subunit-like protein